MSLYQERELPVSKENQIAKQRTRTTQLLDYNQAAERIFKLKVLEFLNNGKSKLFRSASEGNYIVRLTTGRQIVVIIINLQCSHLRKRCAYCMML